jgi:butyrate kinase
MSRYILCINFGSTSTKLALYDNSTLYASKSIDHSKESLKQFNTINEQLPLRQACVEDFLAEQKISVDMLSAISARAGVTPPVDFGAYVINECMVDRLMNKPVAEHAMNLCAVVAYRLALGHDIPVITYDSCTTDQMEPVYKLSGIPEITRSHMSHVENIRAVAFKAADTLERSYPELNLIVAHMGGGISATAHRKGRIIDSMDSNDGAFSPERSGILPSRPLAKLIYSGKFTESEMLARLEGNGGMTAYLGTSDGREVEKRIAAGDTYAKLVYEAMAVQVSKEIGQLATDLCGEVDAIVLTGGLAHSSMFTEWIQERVSFIAPLMLYPGEYEMESLALGALRVLNGSETAKIYSE